MLLHSPLQNERLNAHTHISAIDSKVTINFLRPKKDSNQQKNFPTPFKPGALLQNKNSDLPGKKELSLSFYKLRAKISLHFFLLIPTPSRVKRVRF